ncbi:hypothetical protein OIU34_19040 [Pararhizobium sp. BT-229]|uniref:hypothetical protein n=1 Tax=Pararhizobium sp. BT-229 TaxID=2986923 RepID=UPI0021F7A7F2|nr:hypothetical protein [Pararhizobium sp. BT-229]MCV9963978.1 hypothetical protein [Pararhizobium sp. BT-229]
MRIHMQHPAIVSRRKRVQSEPAYAMVKVTSPVEVAEYSLGDVQTAVILHHGRATTTYRRIGEHLFKQLDHMPAAALADGTDMIRAMLGRENHFDFGSFMGVVEAAGHRMAVEEATGLKNVAYLDRALSRSEQRAPRLPRQLKAFDKAPVMGTQSWIGGEADGEIADWARNIQDFMGNVAVVDGTVHVRSFEPCYRMNLRPPETRTLSLERMRVMETFLGEPKASILGVPVLGKGWEQVDDRYFSLNERDRAVELAEQFGFTREWIPPHTPSATVVDASALSSDFIREETLRLAVAALWLTDDVANELASLAYSNIPGREALAARLAEISAAEAGLREIVADSSIQDDAMLDAATKTLTGTFVRDGEILDPTTTRRIGALDEALVFLDARRDAMPISVMTTNNSPSPR